MIKIPAARARISITIPIEPKLTSATSPTRINQIKKTGTDIGFGLSHSDQQQRTRRQCQDHHHRAHSGKAEAQIIFTKSR